MQDNELPKTILWYSYDDEVAYTSLEDCIWHLTEYHETYKPNLLIEVHEANLIELNVNIKNKLAELKEMIELHLYDNIGESYYHTWENTIESRLGVDNLTKVITNTLHGKSTDDSFYSIGKFVKHIPVTKEMFD